MSVLNHPPPSWLGWAGAHSQLIELEEGSGPPLPSGLFSLGLDPSGLSRSDGRQI